MKGKQGAEPDESWSCEELAAGLLDTPSGRVVARENSLRREMGAKFDAARKAKGWSVRRLAQEMGTSKSQVQRVLHKELGGTLTLRTIVRACQALGLALETIRII